MRPRWLAYALIGLAGALLIAAAILLAVFDVGGPSPNGPSQVGRPTNCYPIHAGKVIVMSCH